MNWKKGLMMNPKKDYRCRGGGLRDEPRGGESGRPYKMLHPFNPAALKSTPTRADC